MAETEVSIRKLYFYSKKNLAGNIVAHFQISDAWLRDHWEFKYPI